MFKSNKRLIGLTGGIATGKSTVSNYLHQKYQLTILDADIYAREAVLPNSSIILAISNRYGNSILQKDGSLNRKALGEIIFNNSQEKTWLESLIHPYVRHRFETEIEQLQDTIIVLVIPLLFEAKMTDLVTEIWLVYCEIEKQINRLITRDKLTKTQAKARINSQLPVQFKIQNSDVILDNSLMLEDLYRKIDEQFY